MANQRFDKRTKGEFADDIKRYTKRETFLWGMFLKELDFLGMEFSWCNNGCDNSGEFVAKPTKDADYLLTIGENTRLLEIKLAPHHKYATFKVADLQAYISQQAHILLFYSSRKFVRSIEDIIGERKYLLWAILSPDIISRILDENKPFPFSGYGGKLSVQIISKDFPKYFNLIGLKHCQ